MLVTALAARLLDQDLAHRPRRGAEEVPPALPAGILVADQPQVGLVDQGGRLERLPGAQLLRQRRGQAAQLVVDRRQQVRRRPGLFRRLPPHSSPCSFAGHVPRWERSENCGSPPAPFSYEEAAGSSGDMPPRSRPLIPAGEWDESPVSFNPLIWGEGEGVESWQTP